MRGETRQGAQLGSHSIVQARDDEGLNYSIGLMSRNTETYAGDMMEVKSAGLAFIGYNS